MCEDVGIDYEMDEAVPNKGRPSQSRLASNRAIRKSLGIPDEDDSTKIDPVNLIFNANKPKADKDKVINLSEEFFSVGRKAPDYHFPFQLSYPSVYENQPFTLDFDYTVKQPTNNSLQEAPVVDKGEKLSIKEFLFLCYPGKTPNEKDLVTKFQIDVSRRRKFIRDPDNYKELIDQYSEGKGTDHETIDATKFMEELKELG